MKTLMKVALLTSLFTLVSCAHHRKCNDCAKDGQCKMKCDSKDAQCPMKSETAPATAPAETPKK